MFVRLLGVIGAGADADHVAPVPGRLPAGLLAQLALAQGRPVSPDALAAALWDAPPESARNALHVAVFKLRKQLGADLVPGAARAGYRLSTAVVRVDWWEAEQLATAARGALDSGRPGEALTAAEAAIALFAGEPLAGLTTKSAESVRYSAERLRKDLSILRGRALILVGRPDQAVEVMRRQVADDPLDEPGHVVLMQALAAAGRPTEALAVHELLRRRLADELGVDPSPQVNEVFRQLLNPDHAQAPTPATGRVKEMTIRLPAVGQPLIGRDADLAEIVGLFLGGHRLVTLVGPGGVGKTQLAITVARDIGARQSRPVVFVDLAAATNPTEVRQALVSALESDGSEYLGALTGTNTLLVLDNAEHVVETVVTECRDILGVAHTGLLVTSRTPLKLRDESIWWVDGLAADRSDSPSVRLLAERAGIRAAQQEQHADQLLTLARAADGLPLALELLASALRWQSPRELIEALDLTLPQLTDDVLDRPQRQISLNAVTDWSLRNISDDARIALGALGLFRGPFDVEAATVVLTATNTSAPPREVLAELVDQSVLHRLPDPGRIRFRILEPLRICAAASDLVPHPAPEVVTAYANHFLSKVAEADANYAVDEETIARLMREDSTNINRAIQSAWAADPDSAMEYLGALLFAWHQEKRDRELLEWSETALMSQNGGDGARARVALARLSLLLWHRSEAKDEIDELFVLVDPRTDEFIDEWHRRWADAKADHLGQAGQWAEAVRWIDRARGSTTRDDIRRSLSRAHFLVRSSEYALARQQLDAAFTSAALGSHPRLHAQVLSARGYVAVVEGDLTLAARCLRKAEEIAATRDLLFYQALINTNTGWFLLSNGSPEHALMKAQGILSDPGASDDRELIVEVSLIAGLALARLNRTQELIPLADALSAVVGATPTLLDPWQADRLSELIGATRTIRTATIDPGTGYSTQDLVRLAARAWS